MKLRKRILIVPSVLVALVAALPSAAEVLDRVIAKVNGEIISLSDLQTRQAAALREARIAPEQAEAYLRQNNSRILQEAIDDVLIAQKAEESGDTVPPEYLKQIIDQIKKDHDFKTEEQFQDQLRREGVTIEEIKRNITRSLLTRRLLTREVEPKASVSDAEARADYEARKASEYTQAPTEQLQEILISSKEPDAAAKAREIVERARKGEDFANLAREYSAAPSRSSGGDLGRVARRDMNAALVKTVASLEPGQVSDPISTAAGYRILRVVARNEGQLIPFEEVKPKIVERLSAQKHEEQLDKLLKKLRAEALIQDMVREVPLQVGAVEARPTLMDAATAPPPKAVTSPADEDGEIVSKPGQVKKVAPGTTNDAQQNSGDNPSVP